MSITMSTITTTITSSCRSSSKRITSSPYRTSTGEFSGSLLRRRPAGFQWRSMAVAASKYPEILSRRSGSTIERNSFHNNTAQQPHDGHTATTTTTSTPTTAAVHHAFLLSHVTHKLHNSKVGFFPSVPQNKNLSYHSYFFQFSCTLTAAAAIVGNKNSPTRNVLQL